MTQLTLRAMMLWLGFIQDAADKLFDGQEIDSIDEWLKLGYDNVNTLLWNVRKPGSGRQGEMISFKADINIHLTVFFVRHKNHTSWSMDYSDISVPNICAMRKQQEMESDKEKILNIQQLTWRISLRPLRQWSNTYVGYTYVMGCLPDKLRDQQVILCQFQNQKIQVTPMLLMRSKCQKKSSNNWA